jgi:hypothetical protein
MTTALLTHILIATGSLVFTSYTFFRPSLGKIRVSYGLIGGVFVSGVWLIASTPGVHILSTCVTGLLYVGFLLAAVGAAQYRLSKQTVHDHD